MLRAVLGSCWLLLLGAEAWCSEAAIQAFAELPAIENPRLSPDGSRYACLISSQGRQLLAVMKPGSPAVTIQAADSDELTSWDWVDDEWLVVTIASNQKFMGTTWRVTRVIGVRASDATVVNLSRDGDAQHASDILWIAQDGSPRVLLAVQQSIYSDSEKFFPEVFEVDVSTGKRRSRVRPRMHVMDWYADGDGVVRMGLGYRDLVRESHVLYRDRDGETFRTIDRASARNGESLEPVPALFLAGSGKALAYSNHSGFLGLYELDLASSALGKEVFTVPGYDIDGLIKDPYSRELLGVRYTDTRPRTQWLEPVMAKAQRDLEQALGPERHVQIVSMSRNQRILLVKSSTGSDPGSYYLLDMDRRSLKELARIRPAIIGYPLQPPRSLRYKARDGLEIEAILTLPAQREARNLPLIVMPHGGPQARDDESFDWWAQYLAHSGYAVIQPNFRGSSGYGKRFSASAEGQWGLAMQDDLIDAVDHLAAAGIADPKRVCMLGGSYGGYAALRAAQRDGARLRCAVSFAGISDLVEMVQYDNQFMNSGRSRDWLTRQSPDLRAVSPINGLDQFSIPVLLLHGKLDRTVPAAQSSTISRALKAAGKPVRHVEWPLADHHLRRAADRVEFLRELTTFLAEHNPADARSTAVP